MLTITHRRPLAAFIAALGLAGLASAGVPSVAISVTQAGAGNIQLIPVGVPDGDAVGYSTGDFAIWGMDASFDMQWSQDPSTSNDMFGGGMRIRNRSSSTQRFTIELVISTASGLGSPVLGGGGVSGVLMGGPTGGTISSIGSSPLWSAFMVDPDGTRTVASLLAGSGGAPFSVVAAAADTSPIPGETFGDPIPSLPIGNLGTARGIRMDFTLSAGSEASLFTNFVVQVIPAPGALAMLAVAGVGAGRRRK
jgi:hypothetical protein